MTTPEITLNSGTVIPQLGLGVWQATNDETERAVRFALDDAGYRHIDTAAAYGNEEGVGRGIAKSAVPRDEVFVTTKLWNSDQGYEPTLAAFDTSLSRSGSTTSTSTWCTGRCRTRTPVCAHGTRWRRSPTPGGPRR